MGHNDEDTHVGKGLEKPSFKERMRKFYAERLEGHQVDHVRLGKVRAHNEDGKGWDLKVGAYNIYRDGEKRAILSFGSPIEYYLDDLRRSFTAYREAERICIDAGGRNFGSRSSVCVSFEDLRLAMFSAQAALDKDFDLMQELKKARGW